MIESCYALYTDGACWGNPGETAAGMVILDEKDNEIYKCAVYLGHGTNNTAEYSAISEGLQAALGMGIDKLSVYSDSQLVIRQLNGEYKIKSESLKPFRNKVLTLASKFSSLEFIFLKREYTKEPHNLAERLLKNRKEV